MNGCVPSTIKEVFCHNQARGIDEGQSMPVFESVVHMPGPLANRAINDNSSYKVPLKDTLLDI
jgi:hypothetical protein